MTEQGTNGADLPDGADLPGWVRDALRCPRCGAELRERSGAPEFVCVGGGAHRYPVADGIVRLIDEDR